MEEYIKPYTPLDERRKLIPHLRTEWNAGRIGNSPNTLRLLEFCEDFLVDVDGILDTLNRASRQEPVGV